MLAFLPLPNDRPEGPGQPSFLTSISVRSDFADALLLAIQRVHGFGCALPLLTPPRVLPALTPGQPTQPDFLELLGRVLQVAPGAILADPAVDPCAVARLEPDPPDAWQLVVRELDQATRISEASWVAVQASDAGITIVPPALRRYLPIATHLAEAGWYSAEPYAPPTSASAQGSLPRLVNLTGLVRGQTRLGDELNLLYPRAVVAASALAAMVSWVWNGTTFVPPSTTAS